MLRMGTLSPKKWLLQFRLVRLALRFRYALLQRRLSPLAAWRHASLWVADKGHLGRKARKLGLSVSALHDEIFWAGFGGAWSERNQPGWAQDTHRSFLVDHISPLARRRVLEVGAGFCGNLALLKERHPALYCVGIDISRTALHQGHALDAGLDFAQASAYHLPFRSHCFDTVFTSGVLQHLPPADVAQALDEILRVSCQYALFMEWSAPGEPPWYVPAMASEFHMYNHPWEVWLSGDSGIRVNGWYLKAAEQAPRGPGYKILVLARRLSG